MRTLGNLEVLLSTTIESHTTFPAKVDLSQAISSALVATALSETAVPKIALVRIKDIDTALASTAAIQQKNPKDRFGR
jgi:hypothetical protein